jgi:hypothetical protein
VCVPDRELTRAELNELRDMLHAAYAYKVPQKFLARGDGK